MNRPWCRSSSRSTKFSSRRASPTRSTTCVHVFCSRCVCCVNVLSGVKVLIGILVLCTSVSSLGDRVFSSQVDQTGSRCRLLPTQRYDVRFCAQFPVLKLAVPVFGATMSLEGNRVRTYCPQKNKNTICLSEFSLYDCGYSELRKRTDAYLLLNCCPVRVPFFR